MRNFEANFERKIAFLEIQRTNFNSKIPFLKSSFLTKIISTYVKLQQAYISEDGSIGTWALIGYKGPGDVTATTSKTTNFSYTDGLTAKDTLPAADKTGWTAENNVQLNDCGAKSKWTIAMKKAAASSGNAAAGDAIFTAKVGGDQGDAGCTALTPSFDKIGK